MTSSHTPRRRRPGRLAAATALLVTVSALAPVTTGSAAPADPPPRIGMVADANPGPVGSYPYGIVELDGLALMSMSDVEHGTELWVSDGTEAGTRLLVDLDPTSVTTPSGTFVQSSRPYGLTRVGDLVYFSAYDGVHDRQLWRTDGTPDGTVRLTDVDVNDNSFEPGPGAFTDVGGVLYFTVDDTVHGSELWTSDGTVAGTHLVADINPKGGDVDPHFATTPYSLVALGDEVLFNADDGIHGNELWRSDGTEAGTTMVSDINPSPRDDYLDGSEPYGLVAMGDAVYFSADDGVSGRELWTSDGTAGGTHVVADIRPGSYREPGYGRRPWSSSPMATTVVGDALYFFADDGVHGEELWTSDGTAAGTRMVKDIDTTREVSEHRAFGRLTELGGRIYFRADDGRHGLELWTSDGTAAGTRLVKDLSPGRADGHPRSGSPDHLTVVGDRLFLVATGADGARRLWSTDGTTAGTLPVRVLDLRPLPSGTSGYSVDLAEVAGELVATVDDGVHGAELWSTTDAALATPVVGNRTRPTVSGVVVAGRTLTATLGTWTPSTGIEQAVQWYVGGRPVPGATGPRYRTTAADVGQEVVVGVVTTHDGYRGAAAFSNPTPRVVRYALVNLSRPVVRGRAEVGRTLTATRGRWSATLLTFRYRWTIGGRPVRGADERTFRVPARAAGRRVAVRVTAVRAAGERTARSQPRLVPRR